MNPEQVRDAAVSALEDIKARDIEILDVHELTSLFDWVVIASADSSRQTRALAQHVMDKTRELGVSHPRMEGEGSGEWILVDAGAVVVHIMQPAIREYYNLGELWGGSSATTRHPILGIPMRRYSVDSNAPVTHA
jgi:ribosome-associated protein